MSGAGTLNCINLQHELYSELRCIKLFFLNATFGDVQLPPIPKSVSKWEKIKTRRRFFYLPSCLSQEIKYSFIMKGFFFSSSSLHIHSQTERISLFISSFAFSLVNQDEDSKVLITNKG